VVSFTLRPLCRNGKPPNTYWIGGWWGFIADPDAVEKKTAALLLPAK
jgi:hypothetical protein